MTRRDDDILGAEIHRKALANLTNEMAIALRRTSGSPIVVEAMDFSTCLLDADIEHLGFAAYVLFHLGTSLLGTRFVAERVKETGEVRPGDGWIVNDPYDGGTHLPDITVLTPVFAEGQCVAMAASMAHHSDLGGMAIGSLPPDATELFQEGLVVSPDPTEFRWMASMARRRVVLSDGAAAAFIRSPTMPRTLATTSAGNSNLG